MKVLLLAALALSLNVASQARAQVVSLPDSEVVDNTMVELDYDAETQDLTITYNYMNNNSCSKRVARLNVVPATETSFGEISFDLVGRPGQICLMVLRAAQAVVTIPNFSGHSTLRVGQKVLGFLLLSDDGESVSFERNSVITLPPVGSPQ